MEKFAHIALYIKDRKTNRCYGVANSHVTRFISGAIYLKEQGNTFHIERTNTRTTPALVEHLDLIEIQEIWSHKLANWYVNNGVPYSVSCFKDSRDVLFEKEVFKLRTCNYWNREKEFGTIEISRIAKADDHSRVLPNKVGEFLVEHKLVRFPVLVRVEPQLQSGEVHIIPKLKLLE